MNELGIFVQNDRVVVSSRDVARVFEKRHDRVMQDIRSLDCGEEFNLHNFVENSYVDEKNRSYPQYLITRDGFTLLAMGYTGSKAMQFKIAYIDAFNAMESELKNKYASQIPASFADALELAAKTMREKEALSAKIEEDRPKVAFADAVATSDTSISVGVLSKILAQKGMPTGQNRLFKWMRENGYLMQRGDDKNIPTQKAIEMGLFEVKEYTITPPDKPSRIKKTTKVTGKGQQYFIERFLPQGGA